MRLPAGIVLACLLAGGTSVAREHTSDARHHLKKANELAEEGHCAAAARARAERGVGPHAFPTGAAVGAR